MQPGDIPNTYYGISLATNNTCSIGVVGATIAGTNPVRSGEAYLYK